MYGIQTCMHRYNHYCIQIFVMLYTQHIHFHSLLSCDNPLLSCISALEKQLNKLSAQQIVRSA